jgi:hypothetical protein
MQKGSSSGGDPNRLRILSAAGVPPGSRVLMKEIPRAVKSAAMLLMKRDFPTPSPPSIDMNLAIPDLAIHLITIYFFYYFHLIFATKTSI